MPTTEPEVFEAFINWGVLLKDFIVGLVAFGGAIAALRGWIMKPIKKQQELDKEQTKKIDALITKIDKIDKNVADIMWNQLQGAHDTYVTMGWCSSADKQRLDRLYTEYHTRGYNHLADNYLEEIMKLPEFPA